MYVYDALSGIYENSDVNNTIELDVSCLLICVKQFKFLCLIVIWYQILNHINLINKPMQFNNYDLCLATDGKIINFFENVRSDGSVIQLISGQYNQGRKLEDCNSNFRMKVNMN